jgi:citrate lyase subunit beta/citryl-CoA lyase
MKRSLLFIPANSPAMLQNADIFGADAIIFDLEDAIHPLEKDAARDLLTCYLERFALPDVELIVRINDRQTPYYIKDVERAVQLPIHTIMLPKAREEDILELSERLTALEKKRKRLAPLMIIPIIERAISLFEIEKIVAHARVSGLLLGGEDLTSDLEVERTKQGLEILFARQMVIYAAKAYRKEAIDTPFTDVGDHVGLVEDATYAKSLGMTAKSCIHPIQIDAINEVFSPSEKQITFAKRVLEAEKEAQEKGLGVFSVDGKMVDKPIIERAKQVLKRVKP